MFELGEKVGNPPNIYILPCQYAESDFWIQVRDKFDSCMV
jgi:hypothetical protein